MAASFQTYLLRIFCFELKMWIMFWIALHSFNLLKNVKDSAWNLQHLETYCAKTTVRLWHELYKEKKIAHDFSEMISPKTDYIYFGLIRCNEIRAISECERVKLSTISIKCIANAPNSSHESALLLKYLFENSIKIKNNNQIQWKLESMYLESSFEK